MATPIARAAAARVSSDFGKGVTGAYNPEKPTKSGKQLENWGKNKGPKTQAYESSTNRYPGTGGKGSHRHIPNPENIPSSNQKPQAV